MTNDAFRRHGLLASWLLTCRLRAVVTPARGTDYTQNPRILQPRVYAQCHELFNTCRNNNNKKINNIKQL